MTARLQTGKPGRVTLSRLPRALRPDKNLYLTNMPGLILPMSVSVSQMSLHISEDFEVHVTVARPTNLTLGRLRRRRRSAVTPAG